MDKNILFALDIGTRSVVGMILKQHADGKYEILHMKIKEHEERSMLDGQIHHIPAVAKVIKEIKDELEQHTGPLKKVSVAAAGRALKTVKGRTDKEISETPITRAEEITHLELSAVQHAQFQLASLLDETNNQLYDCVGYSVLHYYLDNQEIGSFIGQQGNTASVEVIATFLPRVVVESLIKALREADLEMEALTLEPIAAINVLIPPSMRKLNVALVDIGAGTSDIALTADGTVVAYGMVPVAGDEITEAISSEYLLDFPIAENVKRSLTDNDDVEFTDILGISSKKAASEVTSSINTAIDGLADKITEEILYLNAKPPQAVMLVGGGSLTPGLKEKIAQKLNIPIERVAIRGINAITSLIPSLDHTGPELVTPVGIGIAARENPVKYVTVSVNEKTVRLFEVKRLTIGDALVAGGAELGKLYGRPGMGLMVRINGEIKLIKGDVGTPPKIFKNGEECSITDFIKESDVIFYESGVNGADACISVKEAVNDHQTKTLYINGKPSMIETSYFVNQTFASNDTLIHDRDDISTYFPETIFEVMDNNHIPFNTDASSFSVFVDKKKVSFPQHENNTLYLNGIAIHDNRHWKDQDELTYNEPTCHHAKLNDLLSRLDLNLYQSCSVIFNNEEITLQRPLYTIIRQGIALDEESVLYPDDELFIEKREHKPFIFQDLFLKVELSINPQPGETLIILKNNEKAGFQTEISTGDHLELKFGIMA
ncbi:cell division protein FtsA [Fictibacillus barbaricus]|uniref:Cell division protein FtsA n=1 Tax=Fictibacillus barbaricus TaxID=182136 RepID=A0ABU1U2Y4_9BACL|nr:cell division protein FtsA [Fictibacillus barbaricus]MDR7073814.1 cell division protein FtsA [Fictibacillus barbaricus]